VPTTAPTPETAGFPMLNPVMPIAVPMAPMLAAMVDLLQAVGRSKMSTADVSGLIGTRVLPAVSPWDIPKDRLVDPHNATTTDLFAAIVPKSPQ
jgi:hypothetical protein